jgi:Resolvase, N terminal domain
MHTPLPVATRLPRAPTRAFVRRPSRRGEDQRGDRDRKRNGEPAEHAIVVVGIDRLGRNAAEVMTTIRELGERNIVLRSLRGGNRHIKCDGPYGGRRARKPCRT